MKKYTIKNIRNLFINLLLIATTILSISSCNDDFLEELPKDQILIKRPLFPTRILKHMHGRYIMCFQLVVIYNE